jgi:hypothetical protein
MKHAFFTRRISRLTGDWGFSCKDLTCWWWGTSWLCNMPVGRRQYCTGYSWPALAVSCQQVCNCTWYLYMPVVCLRCHCLAGSPHRDKLTSGKLCSASVPSISEEIIKSPFLTFPPDDRSSQRLRNRSISTRLHSATTHNAVGVFKSIH